MLGFPPRTDSSKLLPPAKTSRFWIRWVKNPCGLRITKLKVVGLVVEVSDFKGYKVHIESVSITDVEVSPPVNWYSGEQASSLKKVLDSSSGGHLQDMVGSIPSILKPVHPKNSM